MKRILIVSDKFTNGGLETHIRGEIIQLQRHGWDVHVVFGEVSNDISLPAEVKSIATGIRLDSSATSCEMAKSVDAIITITRRHAITLIHAHGFLAPILGMIAAQAETIPLVITVHGPVFFQYFHNHAHQDIITSMVLPEASLLVAVSEEIRAIARTHVEDDNILMLPNAIDFAALPSASEVSDPRFLVVSRLDGDKIDGIFDFVNKARDAGICAVLIVGSGSKQDELKKNLDACGFADFVEFCGFCEDIPGLMQKHAGVAGMGRVVLEAVALKKTTVLIGYDGVKGVVDCDMLERAQRENFSGRGMPVIDAQHLRTQLQTISADELHQVYLLASGRFDERHIWSIFSQTVIGLEHVQKNDLHTVYQAIKGNFFESGLVMERGHIRSLQAQISHVQKQMAALRQEHDEALAAHARLQVRTAEQEAALRQERDEALAAHARLQVRAAEQEAALRQERDAALAAHARSEVRAAEQKVTLTQARNATLAENALLREQLDAVLTSTSWKMTFPLRYLVGKIKRLVIHFRRNR